MICRASFLAAFAFGMTIIACLIMLASNMTDPSSQAANAAVEKTVDMQSWYTALMGVPKMPGFSAVLNLVALVCMNFARVAGCAVAIGSWLYAGNAYQTKALAMLVRLWCIVTLAVMNLLYLRFDNGFTSGAAAGGLYAVMLFLPMLLAMVSQPAARFSLELKEVSAVSSESTSATTASASLSYESMVLIAYGSYFSAFAVVAISIWPFFILSQVQDVFWVLYSFYYYFDIASRKQRSWLRQISFVCCVINWLVLGTLANQRNPMLGYLHGSVVAPYVMVSSLFLMKRAPAGPNESTGLCCSIWKYVVLSGFWLFMAFFWVASAILLVMLPVDIDSNTGLYPILDVFANIGYLLGGVLATLIVAARIWCRVKSGREASQGSLALVVQRISPANEPLLGK